MGVRLSPFNPFNDLEVNFEGEREQFLELDGRKRFEQVVALQQLLVDALEVPRLPLAILPSPVAFPRLMYYQLWHARTHHSAAAIWLRDTVKSVAASLRKE